MLVHPRTSAEALAGQIPGKTLATSRGGAWKDLLVQVFARQRVEESILVPAVAEPLIVWILSGAAVVEERGSTAHGQRTGLKPGIFF
jgi:AraC family transcriptional regulator